MSAGAGEVEKKVQAGCPSSDSAREFKSELERLLEEASRELEVDFAARSATLGGALVPLPRDVGDLPLAIEALLLKSKYAERARKLGASLVAEALAARVREKLESLDPAAELRRLPLVERVARFAEELELFFDFDERPRSAAELAARVFAALSKVFDFVRVVPSEPRESQEVYVRDGNVLYPAEVVVDPVAGAFVERGLARRGLRGDLIQACYSAPRQVTWRDVDPLNYLNLRSGVLNLESLELEEPSERPLFTYKLPVAISREELEEIASGSYVVEENEVYKLWRAHFDDENWNYFVDAVGTWLAPRRFRLVVFLIGPRGCGKSSLLRVLTKPIRSVVGHASLKSIADYTFGLESLLGKQINVYSERGTAVLRNLDAVNRLVGEHDVVEVHRKHRPPAYMYSLKSMVFAMNDPPIVTEYGGETFAAFLDRLSVVKIGAPEGFEPDSSKVESVSAEEAFKFLLWCRVQLEKRGWRVRKLSAEEASEFLTMATNTALQFATDCLEPAPYGVERGKDLYEAYARWCQSRGVTPMSLNDFYTALATRFESTIRDKARAFRRVKLRRECSLDYLSGD